MKRIGWAVMTVLALIIAAYAIALLFVPAMRAPFLQQRFLTISWAAYLHLGGSGLALAVGAFQHNGRIRARYINAHRWLGRTYLIVAEWIILRQGGAIPIHEPNSVIAA